MTNNKRHGLEWIAKHFKQKDPIAIEEVSHHANLQRILESGYELKQTTKDGRLVRFERGSDLILYDVRNNLIYSEYTHGVAHKKPRIDYI